MLVSDQIYDFLLTATVLLYDKTYYHPLRTLLTKSVLNAKNNECMINQQRKYKPPLNLFQRLLD